MTVKKQTLSGLECEAIYHDTPENIAGSYPYRRGIHADMYRARLWTMRQYSGFGSAIETNKRFKYLLAAGTSGLSVAFDLPTQMGHDSDFAIAKGEVGKVGVAISSLDDMELLLADIPLDQVSISMTINSTAAILLSMLLLVAERRGISADKINGTIQNDVLKEYIARGTYIYPPVAALRLITDIFAFCQKEAPSFNTISISGYHIREAGSSAVQELAFTFANAIAYVDAAMKAGLKVDDFGPRLAFFFNGQIDFLEEISKFRAARVLWAKIMRDRFGAKNPRSMMLRFHTQTAGSSLTQQQPLNNVVRTTIEAMAAVLGGTQSLHTNGFDEALSLPTEDSAKLALRTQQIIAHESGITSSVDPLAGSYLIESWTDRLITESEKLIQKIDDLGGMQKAIEADFPSQEIEREAYRYQREVESGERKLVGVNSFTEQESVAPPLLKVDPQIELDQVARLKAYKNSRDKLKLDAALSELKTAAAGNPNLVYPIKAALRANATLGEISNTLRTVFGEWR